MLLGTKREREEGGNCWRNLNSSPLFQEAESVMDKAVLIHVTPQSETLT